MFQRKISGAAAAAAVATAALIALPAFSSGATVKSDLNSYAPAQTRATSPTPKTEPPLHGSNPHGQGSVAVVDVGPSATRPFSADTSGSTDSEDIVVGRARGEQRADGTYHGHITVAALFGNEILAGADTTVGQSVDEDIGQGLLTGPNSLCSATTICLNVVHVTSSTTATGSTNRFNLANATIGAVPGLPVGTPGLSIGAATSNGNIGTTSTCQTSRGDSNVANVSAGATIADAATSSSETTACRGLAPTQTNSSSVVNLGTTGLVIPPLIPTGCGTGAADTVGGIPVLLEIVCNADDSSNTGGTQTGGTATSDPYGVRDALDVYVLATGQTATAKVSTSSSESSAHAPAAVVTPPPPVAPPPPPVAPPPPAAVPPPPPATTTPTVPTTTTPATTPTDDGTADNGGDDTGSGTGDNSPGAGAAACSDKVDNDGDGKIDFGKDPGCSSATDNSEADGSGNLGAAATKKLPFTGTDVVGLGLAGALLLAAGLALRGPTRRRRVV